MCDHRMASDRGFAFALALERNRNASTQGRLRLEPIADAGGSLSAAPWMMSSSEWFDLLQAGRGYSGPISAEWRLELEWS
jgi:hypothetical protein